MMAGVRGTDTEKREKKRIREGLLILQKSHNYDKITP